jgi:hypothetical protein
MKRGKFYLFLLFVIIFVFVTTFFVQNKYKHYQNIENAGAATGSKTLTTTAEWDAGTKTNILTASDQLTINSKGVSAIDLVTLSNADPSIVTSSTDVTNKNKAADGNLATFWETYLAIPGAEDHQWWQIDLGALHQLEQVRVNNIYNESVRWKIQTSTDGIAFTDQSAYIQVSGWQNVNFSAQARYIRIEVKHDGTWGEAPNPPPWDVPPYPQPCSALRINEVEASGTGFATHISAPTQINGGDNFFQWQTFTPTQTVPANTSVSYRFRTSPDASNWTSWSASQTPTSGNALDISSLVTSKSGDTYYKYLQVETTLSNTDGASTPTVDSYTIGYHTNQKPNKPVAVTAVIGQ